MPTLLLKTPSLSFREDKEEAEEGVDDEDVHTCKTYKKYGCRSGTIFFTTRIFCFGGGQLAYNEEWDETAELHSDSEVENNDQ